MASIRDFAKGIWDEPFKRYLVLGLVLLGIYLAFFDPFYHETESGTDGKLQVHFFYLDTCPHCAKQKIFNERLKDKYPEAEFAYHEVSRGRESAIMERMGAEIGFSAESVPVTVVCGKFFEGYRSDETTGAEIDMAISDCLGKKESQKQEIGKDDETRNKIEVPFLGAITPADYSLPALAAVLGLIDGFNPCAMWVLVYMIGIALTLRDRRKIWILVGTFVLSSGVLYFLFMTAWLNAFLLLGYMRAVTIAVGLVALGGGILSIREYIRTKGALACETTDAGSKKKTMGRIQEILHSEITWGALAGIIALAFVVNSIEFACSAAIPAVFTEVLALSSLAAWKHYAYILLYDIFFMLDDLIIFSLAAFAISSSYGEKYAKYCRIIGGVIMLVLGMLLLFAPDLLR